MTQNNIAMYRVVPIFALAISFWIYTNKQMFDNDIEAINSPNQIRKSFHLITNLDFSDLDWWQQKLIYALVAYIVILILTDAYISA